MSLHSSFANGSAFDLGGLDSHVAVLDALRLRAGAHERQALGDIDVGSGHRHGDWRWIGCSCCWLRLERGAENWRLRSCEAERGATNLTQGSTGARRIVDGTEHDDGKSSKSSRTASITASPGYSRPSPRRHHQDSTPHKNRINLPFDLLGPSAFGLSLRRALLQDTAECLHIYHRSVPAKAKQRFRRNVHEENLCSLFPRLVATSVFIPYELPFVPMATSDVMLSSSVPRARERKGSLFSLGHSNRHRERSQRKA